MVINRTKDTECSIFVEGKLKFYLKTFYLTLNCMPQKFLPDFSRYCTHVSMWLVV